MMEQGADFQDLLEAYTEEMAQTLGSADSPPRPNDNMSNSSKKSSCGSVVSGNDELSWEVMDLEEQPDLNSPNSQEHLSPKSKTGPSPWVLQPDIDKTPQKEESPNFPVIQNVVSLKDGQSEPDDLSEKSGDKSYSDSDSDSNNGIEESDEEDNSSVEEEEEKGEKLDDEDGDEDGGNLVIDTSEKENNSQTFHSGNEADEVKNVNDKSVKTKRSKESISVENGIETKPYENISSSHFGPSLSSLLTDEGIQNNDLSKGKGNQMHEKISSDKHREENVKDSHTPSTKISAKVSKGEKPNDKINKGKAREIERREVDHSPSPEQIEVYSINPDTPKSDTHTAVITNNSSPNNCPKSTESITKKPKVLSPSQTFKNVTKSPTIMFEKGQSQRSLILVESPTPLKEPQKPDNIKFEPNTIKEDVQRSRYESITGGRVSGMKTESITTSASLSTGTLLSSSLSYTQSSVAPAHFSSGPTPLTMTTPRTLLKSPPGKHIPQVMLRPFGTGQRPSYVRLGSEALHQIARLTSPPGSVAPAVAAPRMISVLMDRMQTPTASCSIPLSQANLNKIPQGGLVSSAGPNTPVKVLIIPSQSGASSVAIPSMKSQGLTTLSTGSKNKVATTASREDVNIKHEPRITSKKRGPAKLPKVLDSFTFKKMPSGVTVVKDIGENLMTMEERFKRRFLSKNNILTKPYNPLLTSKMNLANFKYYSCQGCRDVFVNEVSLERHKKRESVNIFFRCKVCKLKILFTNKCQFRCHLLTHVPEIKNFNKTLLESVDIQSIQNSTPKDVVHDTEVDFYLDQNKLLEEKKFDNTESAPSQLPAISENKHVSGSIQPSESESGLGLTISSVSSISPEENIPVGENMHNQDHNNKNQTALSSTPVQDGVQNFLKAHIESASGTTVTVPVAGINFNGQLVPVKTINPASLIASKDVKSGHILDKKQSLIPVNIKPISTPPSMSSSLIKKVKTEPDKMLEDRDVICVECKKTFPTYMHLQKHFNDADKYHPIKPICCNIRLANNCAVKAHKRMHTLKRPLVCQDCGEVFRGDSIIYEKHIKNCAKVMKSAMIVYPCPRCTDWCQRIDDLRSHIKEKHSESYLKCNICPMAFKSMPSFQGHLIAKHQMGKNIGHASFSSIYKCPLCDSVFHEQKMKLEHLEHHINSIYALQKVSYFCSICNKILPSYVTMRRHLRDKHQISILGRVCDYCGMDCGQMEDLIKHLQDNHNALPGNLVKVPDTPEKIRAIAGESENIEEEDRTENGKDIAKSQASKDGSEEVGSIVQGLKDTSDTGSNNSPGNLSRNSSMYSETFSDDNAANGDSKFHKCHICLANFGRRKDLIEHKKLEHGFMKRKRPRSEVVAKKIKLEDDCLTPELQVQSDFLLRFMCDSCDYRTTTFGDLQQHRENSHGLQARFPCHLCGRTQESQSKLDEHIKDSHEGQVREYIFTCWVCEGKNIRKGYNKRLHLIKHLVNNHKVPARLIDNKRLDEMEMKAKLSSQIKRDVDDDSQPKTEKDPNSDLFACVKCDYECSSREDFTQHIHSHKLASDSYLCYECGMCFTVTTALKNHLKLVHKEKKFEEYMKKYDVKIVPASPVVERARNTWENKETFSQKSIANPLECNVCYKTFGHAGALKNHIRSHGMAFIRSKRMVPHTQSTEL